jgi:hypothetical protein
VYTPFRNIKRRRRDGRAEECVCGQYLKPIAGVAACLLGARPMAAIVMRSAPSSSASSAGVVASQEGLKMALPSRPPDDIIFCAHGRASAIRWRGNVVASAADLGDVEYGGGHRGMSSVIKKRRKGMNKHKLRKRMRAQRFQKYRK